MGVPARSDIGAPRPPRRLRRAGKLPRRAGVIALVMAVGMSVFPLVAGAASLSGAAGSTLAREPQITPDKLGSDGLEGLQFGDPTEQIDLVEPPVANNQGNAGLSLPLTIPPGRGGVQPDLTLQYDSGGGNGWLGMGWDLNVGEISVDTRWGVPRYLPGQESETYMLDGAVLSPTAVRSDLEDRVPERADFTRRADDQYDLIIRHGDSPETYWWEVRTKLGGIRWYGGFPDEGGPTGSAETVDNLGGTRDPSAILTDERGRGYRWALSAERDIGYNSVRYFYDKVSGQREGSSFGQQLYLSRVLYTVTVPIGGRETDPPEDAPYQVTFHREGGRKDVIVDARGGFLQVTSDRLRRVEVHYGDPVTAPNRRTYNQLSRAYNLNYVEGAFGKTLLKSVDQVGSDGATFATNVFNYFDDVRNSDGSYDGFSSPATWDVGSTGVDIPDISLGPFSAGSSALGSSQTIAGDVHAYLGFNLSNPTKAGSVGASLTVNAGVTEASAEMLDINGDMLPDKVFRKGIVGPVFYRLNRSGPDGGTDFGDEHRVLSLPSLSSDVDVGVSAAIEANFAASVQFNVAATLTLGEDYFTDVNNDGLVDFISGGQVFFNHLEGSGDDRRPNFSSDSSQTLVPIDTDAGFDLPFIEKLAEIEKQQRAQSPLHDTVRRWIAPFDGVVAVEGPVTFDPTPDTRIPPPPYDGDGVRVTIERGGDQLWAAALVTPGQVATPVGVGTVPVSQGDPIYFRVQSIDDGRRDQVAWSPVIRYVNAPPQPRLDVNGLDVYRYDAAQEFTIAGRGNGLSPDGGGGIFTEMPLDGLVRVKGKVRKTKVTTDDVRVVITKNGVPVLSPAPVIPAAFVGDTPVDVEFPVLGPRGDNETDKVSLRLAVDSPIDVTALAFTDDAGTHGPQLFYTSATSKDGQPVTTTVNGEFTLQMHPVYDIDIYSASNLGGPQPGVVLFPDNANGISGETRVVDDIEGLVSVPGVTDRAILPARIVFTVKSREGLACKQVTTLPSPPPPAPGLPAPAPIVAPTADCSITAVEGREYFFDFSLSDPRLAMLPGLRLDAEIDDDDVPWAAHWPRPAVVNEAIDAFPEPFRGWGFAGYNGEGDRAGQTINPGDFFLRRDDFSEREPTGFDDTEFKEPTKGKSFPLIPFHLDLKDAAGTVVGTERVWRGFKDNLVGAAAFTRASRTAADNPAVVQPGSGPPAGDGVRAVPRIGVTAPAFALAAGISGPTVSFAMAPSFGLLDYMDLNGDGFPDVVAPGHISYTGPRGGFFDPDGFDPGGAPAVVAQDFTFAVGAGFSGSAADITGNSQGDANTAKNTSAPTGGAGAGSTGAAGQGDSASPDDYGKNIGGAIGLNAEFTNLNLNAIDPAWGDALSDMPTAPLGTEEDWADVNGDGLPDRILVDPVGVQVQLNLGYRFTGPIRWASGGFEMGTGFSGSVGGLLGFQIFNKGYSGGLSYNESIDFPQYSWADVDGDGILDRLRASTSGVRVAFGTGAGVMDEVDYGSFAQGEVALGAVPTGEAVAQGRTRGLGAGFDFTIGLGPICPPVGCYIIINPGVHFDVSTSSTQVDFSDINGDGYPDSMSSDFDDKVEVRLNNRGRTNLLQSVTNPLGGQTRLNYSRNGNKVDQPASQWDLTSVEVDDGRPGDGPNVLLTTYEYSGNRFSPLERELLGYSKVVERQRSFRGDGNRYDDPLLRSVERTFRNGTVFESGIMTSEVLQAPGGRPLKETRTEWRFVDLATGQPDDLGFRPGDAAGVRFLGMSVAPQRTKVEHRWYDEGGGLGQQTWSTFEYDDLGNVVREVDFGEPELPEDDVTAVTTYSSCPDSASDDYLKIAFPCPAPRPAGRISPLWTPSRCPTWTSIPATFQVLDAQGRVMRDRNGAPALCDNSSVTHLVERVGEGQEAVTDLSYDEWGSYSHIVYPANADGERLRIDYVYDGNGHANVALTTRTVCMDPPSDPDLCDPEVDPDPNGITASAVYDGRTGRIASRTDANGQRTSYTYDAAGRLASITRPAEQGAHRTVTFEYFPRAADYAYAVAHHHDAFNPGNTIDTVSFVDGAGRETQTKQDATRFSGAGGPPTDVMVVSGAVEFDDLWRPVKEWLPIYEDLGTAGRYNFGTSAVAPKLMTLDLLDRVVDLQHHNGSHTRTEHGFDGDADFGAKLFTRTITDQEGNPQRTFSDVRDYVHAVDERLTPADRIRTRYAHDGLGQLVEVTDNGGNKTTHGYDLGGRRISTRTPDGGLLEKRWDPASNLVAEVDENMRANNTLATYSYDAERLVAIDYPEGTPDVAYTWGAKGAPGNGAGRVVAVKDGARDQELAYDAQGSVATEVTTMLVHNLNDSTGQRHTYRTAFTYDSFGRLGSVTYPDGEVLTNGYDSGGRLKSVAGDKAGRRYGYLDRLEYDEFFNRRFQQTANGVRTEYEYDVATQRLTRQTSNTPAREVQDLNYTYDLVGNVRKMENRVPDPVPELKGGPSTQEYEYDIHYRLTSAKGTYAFAPRKVRDYTFEISYDVNGNVATKSQTDVIDKKLTQKPTTYDLDPVTYREDRPHQLTKVGTRSYTFDPNGNFTGWTDDRSGQNRTVTWDGTDRMRSVADQGSTTTYTYDSTGRLAIERGPQGEKAFVNEWFTVLNGSVSWKRIWAGKDQLATQRTFDDGAYEHMRYFMHKDLLGSTNVVTDDGALVFQHLEYFPSGEIWIHEKSDVFRTPYLMTGAYYDEIRNLVDLGERWYEPREQFVYSPDPVLRDEPAKVIDNPALLPAYGYAESNPVTLVDPDGRAAMNPQTLLTGLFVALSKTERAAFVQATARSTMQSVATAQATTRAAATAPKGPVAGQLRIEAPKATRLQRIDSKLKAIMGPFEAQPLVKINLVKTNKGWQLKNVRVAPGLTKVGQFKIWRGAAAKHPTRPSTAAKSKT